MSLHKITAGSGYDYLTRQVARHDSTENARPSLASYYTERGEVPGVWVGSGLAGIDGLQAGDEVTAEQMRSLYGAGFHPLADQIRARMAGPGHTQAEYAAAIRLGKPFAVYPDDVSPFRIEVARRFDAHNRNLGRRGDAPIGLDVRARIRTEVARELFLAEYGRPPLDARELTGHLAKLSRQHTTAVAGFDLTFSPVKSVSALWAVADPGTAAQIEQSHHAAVADALTFIEAHALYSRLGAGGVRQVDVRGLIGAAFTHRDSRAGDPDLHTHVAVANKVQTLDGRWLSIDGRVLYKANVAASEVYNTALERRLADALGVRFVATPTNDQDKLSVREIDGLHPGLLQRWSRRRQSIEDRRADLATAFQQRHGRPPTAIEQIALAQQATLDTRDAKHAPRTLAEQRATWRAEALQVCGGGDALASMIDAALHPRRRFDTSPAPTLDGAWITTTAAQIVTAMERRRATWQVWHLRAEALRQARAAQVPHSGVGQVVDALVAEALSAHSVPIGPSGDGISEPQVLRRRDGSSVYSVAGARLFTSAAILAAEARLVAAAGRRDGYAASGTEVDLALLESAANGLELNPGQAALMRGMATSGARVQVAIAPAGSGKTTAMAALSRAWSEAGGTVIGLAPSAAAAAQLRPQINSHTDTLAKLTWHLRHGDAPRWMRGIGARTLVVIDEAGMADTLSLDTAVGWLLDRGASVRLIGDDQQLAAIGAGGVLRDIEANHGVLRLRDLVRFTDPAESAASLALRQGQPEAIGFYLDHHRVHVGDQASLLGDLFDAWATDRANGLDSLMLAPTRDQVAQLNQAARTHRLAGHQPTRTVRLADGNQASSGDTIVTRLNNRQLRMSATDWVKNGDRWSVEQLTAGGGVRARHLGSGLLVTLPADYVASSVELGYACTIHTAQGITVDTVHGLAHGELARQSLYTMLTRGRQANHLYLEVVGDGSEHTVIRPETINPNTPTDLLEAILARDESPVSATTQARVAASPAAQLYDAVHRYSDAVTVAAETLAGPATIATLEHAVDAVLPGVTLADDWHALRSQLLILAADGADPVQALIAAHHQAPLTGARDTAAVLAWRLDGHLAGGPLPWLTGVPRQLATHPDWEPYLSRRAHLVNELADHIADQARTDPRRPAWLTGSTADPTPGLLAQVAVWRAATGVEDADLRPTGPRQPAAAAARWQHRLNQHIAEDRNPALHEWAPLLRALSPMVDHDPYTATLARQLAQLAGAGLNAHHLVAAAAAEGDLPDDHAAAALWWRINRHLTPATTRTLDHDTRIPTNWITQLDNRVGPELADTLHASPYWPALTAAIEDGLQRGWTLDTLLTQARPETTPGTADTAQAMAWRIAIATDPQPDHDDPALPADHTDPNPPEDLYDGWTPNPHDQQIVPDGHELPPAPDGPDHRPADADDVPTDDGRLPPPEGLFDDLSLDLEALLRDVLPVPEPTDLQIAEQLDRAHTWHTTTASPERLAHINSLAADFYTDQYTGGGWAQPYLTGRFGTDLAGDTDYQPGYAPDGWTHLINHLRRLGVTDQELLDAGLATTASTGRLIDRFRDRVVFPITNPAGQILGFVGRRNPARDHDPRTPKYLNTADTPLFHKGAQLFAPPRLFTTPDAQPVLVEGPMDAIAVTHTAGGHYVGVAPLGTALTDDQARQLHTLGVQPIVATDNDPAGRAAADRDYWLLAPYRLNPLYATLPAGTDPADLIRTGQHGALADALTGARPLAHQLLAQRLTSLPRALAIPEALRVIAAQPPADWEPCEDALIGATGAPATLIRLTLKDHIQAFNHDPQAAAQAALDSLKDAQQAARADTSTPARPFDPSQTPARGTPPRLITPLRRPRDIPSPTQPRPRPDIGR